MLTSYVPQFINATLYGFVALALIVTGCSTTSNIAQNSKGSVYLEEIMDWSFDANHPAVIDQTTILKIVKGVYTAETKMSAAGSKPMRVFSDEDAEFLAPLLAQGLSKAKPEQLVVFRVSSSAGSGSEPTAGSIYVQQGAIHFTISNGVGATTFMPESAARTVQAQPFATGGKGGVMAHVIDYHALALAPMPPALPVVKTATGRATGSIANASATATAMEGPAEMQVQLGRAKDMLAKKDTEIRVLRKESDWMKRELRERDEEIKALKATVKTSKPSPKKKAEVYRTR